MDIALRILHIVVGVFWGGTVLFSSFILIPRLRGLGPNIEQSVLKSLEKIMPVFAVCGLITVGTGIAMALRMQGDIAAYFTTGWGLVMFIAFIVMVISLIDAFVFMAPAESRLAKMSRGIEGREPTAKEAQQLEQLSRRIATYDRIHAVMVLIALIIMPISRFM